jgi:hypothetical protein
MNESNDNRTHVGAVMASSVVMIGDNIEDTALGREIKEMGAKVERGHKLTQLLGISLRGVLPYAEQELERLRTAAKDGPEDMDAKDERDNASYRIQRAAQALNQLGLSPLTVENCADEEFDDEFEIRFTDEED